MNVMFTRHGLKAGVRQVNPHRFRHTSPPGDTSQCAGTGRAVPVGALEPNDGEALLCYVRLRAGRGGACDLQSCDAARRLPLITGQPNILLSGQRR